MNLPGRSYDFICTAKSGAELLWYGASFIVPLENANLVQRINFYRLFMYRLYVCIYVSMYVRVSLYFIDIKLDIALIHHLPDLEKRTCLGPALDRIEQEKEKNKIYGVSKTIISNIVTTETAFHCPQKLELNYTDYRMDSRRQKRWKCK